MGCCKSKSVKIQSAQQLTKRTIPAEDEFVEDVVCQDSDIKENEMKVFDLKGEGEVLLIRQNGDLNAVGSKCTHFDAPLQEGVLSNGRVICHWHGACFDIRTGDIEDFPGLDSLPCYQVTVENNNVRVRARKSELKTNRRVKAMVKRHPNNDQHFVVIGGGPSGAVCVETLRQEGFQGKITLIAKEDYYPYDRIMVNKAMDYDISKIQLRKEEFYSEHDIEVKKGCEAVAVGAKEQKVKLYDGSSIDYDVLYIATGCEAKKAPVPGADLKNVLVLRDYDHATYTQSLLSPEKHVVVLGSSFIGMEAAAYCIDKVKKVTIVSKDSVPFEASFGYKVGAGVMKLFEDHGANFIVKSGLNRCIDDGSGGVGSVELLDGTVLKADIVIMGVGSILSTGFLKNSGIELREDGSIEVNEYLQTNISNVFAGGDIAYAPVYARDNIKAVISHYGLAQYHARKAAFNMLNKMQPLKAVPFFWTRMLERSIRYAGYGKYDEIIYVGDPLQLDFVAFYLEGDEVVAISDCGRDPVVAKYADLMEQGKRLYRKDLEGDPLAWLKE
ncbi:hypothetical protein ILUMI_11807 [Ignelater luminosus]|uniref:Rieske domain-containing protein n=1 Tax=Ignelater luminosus TaxID=2038154 RepID=A0A8K0CZF7_IGNLU|nr:hypothetical protein ILUMI_11807 [Ignelater luminosus]